MSLTNAELITIAQQYIKHRQLAPHAESLDTSVYPSNLSPCATCSISHRHYKQSALRGPYAIVTSQMCRSLHSTRLESWWISVHSETATCSEKTWLDGNMLTEQTHSRWVGPLLPLVTLTEGYDARSAGCEVCKHSSSSIYWTALNW